MWEFQIGNGESRPPLSDISLAFEKFDIGERHGKTTVRVPMADAHGVKALIYSDIRGKMWYVENPFFPVRLPEICVHFLLTNTFSSIMRYNPDLWGDIIVNDVQSDISLIVRKYLSAFERKFLIMVLRSISTYYPYVS